MYEVPHFPSLNRWGLEFERDRTSVEDETHSGRPKIATTPEIIDRVHKIV